MNESSQQCSFLIDLDGTLVRGGTLVPGAMALLDRLRGRFAIVSNDAEHTPHQLTRLLAKLGLAVPPERIVLAGATAIDQVSSESPRAKVLLLASAALRRYARRAGLALASKDPDVVVVGRDRQFSYAKLAVAANAIKGGAALLATNPDTVHPGPGGAVVPETGSLLSAILACTGPVAHRVVGKPEPALFLEALARIGATASDSIVVGDNAATDGLGAERLGMRYIAVGNGAATTLADLKIR